MDYLWTWGGKFFGYRDGDLLFTHRGKCVGHFDGDEIYGRHGEYLGELMNGDRLITNRSKKGWRGSTAPAVQGGAIGRYANYVGYAMYVGHEDFTDPDSF